MDELIDVSVGMLNEREKRKKSVGAGVRMKSRICAVYIFYINGCGKLSVPGKLLDGDG